MVYYQKTKKSKHIKIHKALQSSRAFFMLKINSIYNCLIVLQIIYYVIICIYNQILEGNKMQEKFTEKELLSIGTDFLKETFDMELLIPMKISRRMKSTFGAF